MLIGSLNIKGKAALAPMAGVSDSAFRRLCGQKGAAYTVTEMISVKALEYDDKKSFALADTSHDEAPVFIQLFGTQPRLFAEAAKKLLPLNPAGFDINMGCPVPKVVNSGAGSALMKDPRLCADIVKAVKESTPLPVTVKIRSGWDEEHINAAEVAKYCEDAGADAVCVHARTKTQFYSGKADWDVIMAVKKAVTVPVIGNGDVTGAQQAALMLAQTGCDMVMVARAAMGNPWVFYNINAYLNDSCRIMPPVGLAERIVTIRRHIGLMCEYKGEARAMKEARKHVGWYIHGLNNAARFRKRAGELCSLDDLDRLLMDIYAANAEIIEENTRH